VGGVASSALWMIVSANNPPLTLDFPITLLSEINESRMK
jgi:hypothetical protein